MYRIKGTFKFREIRLHVDLAEVGDIPAIPKGLDRLRLRTKSSVAGLGKMLTSPAKAGLLGFSHRPAP
jgi:hypothetical protein